MLHHSAPDTGISTRCFLTTVANIVHLTHRPPHMLLSDNSGPQMVHVTQTPHLLHTNSVGHLVSMQDLEAEKAAEQAAEQQAAKQASTRAGKKQTASDAGPLPSKKAKMASVQELHTASNAALIGSTSQSRSVSPGKSQSAGSTDKEGSLPQQAIHAAAMPDGKLDTERSDSLCPKTTSKSAQDADSADRTVDGKDQHAAVKGSAKALADSDATLQAAGMNPKKDAVKLTEVKEYFVKWKNKSYIHCSWVEHDNVVRVAKVSNGLNLRFKHYQRSVYGMPQV